MIRLRGRTLSGEETNKILAEKRDWILKVCRTVDAIPKQIVAFGSAAYGEFREDSDVDIALIFDDEDALRRAKPAISAAPRNDLRSLDILFYAEDDFLRRAERGGVSMIIDEDGIELYHRGKGLS